MFNVADFFWFYLCAKLFIAGITWFPLNGQCLGFYILLVASFVYESWYWSCKFDTNSKSLWPTILKTTQKKKTVSVKTDDTTKQIHILHKDKYFTLAKEKVTQWR